MAKTKATPAATAPPAKASLKRSAASEIDDLFAAKKPKSAAPPPAHAEPDAEMDEPRKKKAKKDKGKGKAGPEEIVDTSASIERYRPAPAPVLAKKRKAGEDDDGDEKMQEEESNFMDSRGTNRRRTDDGLAIYDIAELKIGLGGDTELCPFDCECCF
ncbi:hypothetical protein RQP46_003536 [Phenoliferia psychrophenolica]